MIPPEIEEAQGLGFKFRPTPRPATDETIREAFDGHLRRLTNIAVSGTRSMDNHMPRLYRSKGTILALDPSEYPAEYKATEALTTGYKVKLTQHLKDTPIQIANKKDRPNITKHESSGLKKLRNNQATTEAGHQLRCFTNDKSRANTIVTADQAQALLDREMEDYEHTPDANEDAIRRSIHNDLHQLLEDVQDIPALRSALSSEEVNYLRTSMMRTTSTPTLQLLLKVHKPTFPGTKLPCSARVVVNVSPSLTADMSKVVVGALRPLAKALPTAVKNTPHAVQKIESLTYSRDDWNEVFFLTYDIVKHFPNAPREKCRDAIRRAMQKAGYSTARIRVILELERMAMDHVYFKAADGKIYKMAKGYGIGVGQSSEVTTIEWGEREALLFEELAHLKGVGDATFPAIDLKIRMVDDALIIGRGSDAQISNLVTRLNQMDPARQITHEIGRHYIEVMDLTIRKLPWAVGLGKLSTGLFKKPTNHGMHLARTSHHPTGTFTAVLNAAADQALVACSREAEWVQALAEADKEFSLRGYDCEDRLQHLWLRHAHSDRQTQIARRAAAAAQLDPTPNLAVVKLPFTARSHSLQPTKLASTLAQEWKDDPTIGHYLQDTRSLTAHMATQNIGSLIRSNGGPPGPSSKHSHE